MPNFDKTGPQGQGPMTGQGRGPCEGVRSCRGCRRFGRRGLGLGFGRFFSSKNNLITLEDEEKILEEELKIIREKKEALSNSVK